MPHIKNIGRFCSTDTNGFLINDSSKKNIKTEFYNLVEDVIEGYRKHLGSDLHSVYIRGSIPRGLGIKGVSDLDTIAITNKKISRMELTWVDKTERELNIKYPDVNGVEFSFYCLKDILETSHFSIIPFMIKTHSVCVYGENVSLQLPDYKADKTVGNDHLVNLKKQIQQAKDDLEGNEDKEDILDCCGWIMKIIVRAGLALVIEKENKYTRDLYPAYRLFSKHYPEQELNMKKAVHYAINPTMDTTVILEFLNEMGEWMINESEKWLQDYNPNRVSHLTL
ncbi:nucleotidyltransferase [Radiobacillus deserti]|uniref:Nucleotidyltransferase n=1 Tax=Radiobacillus deserti TaxID=2594883 RepID=A0A516KIF8_9BACI|nr:nucleotidyltransferase [Radiobacillus deserti]QDP41174.1 nucleotidyltransferase [Radiobacillus deserti]